MVNIEQEHIGKSVNRYAPAEFASTDTKNLVTKPFHVPDEL